MASSSTELKKASEIAQEIFLKITKKGNKYGKFIESLTNSKINPPIQSKLYESFTDYDGKSNASIDDDTWDEVMDLLSKQYQEYLNKQSKVLEESDESDWSDFEKDENLPSDSKILLKDLKHNTSLTKRLIRLKGANNFDIQYEKEKLPKVDKELYKKIVDSFDYEKLKDLRRFQLKEVDKKMNSARQYKTDKEIKKITELKKALELAPNELTKKKLQRKIDKLKDIKDQKILITDTNKLIQNPEDKLNFENTPLINNTELNSYIPKKFIPLFVKNKNGPGYHRITPSEAQQLKNDPSGDYYDGYGIDYNNIFKKLNIGNTLYSGLDLYRNNKPNISGYNLSELKGGSILAIASTLLPAAFNIAKNAIENAGRTKNSRGGFKSHGPVGNGVGTTHLNYKTPTLTNTEMIMDEDGFFHP